MNRAGGAERYCLEMLDTLVKNGFRVTLYTIDKTDWEMIQRIHNLSIKARREVYLQSNPLEPDGIISWIRTAIAYTWLLIRASEETDICINNYGEIMPFFAQVSIVHSVPMSSITENNYAIPSWGLLRRVYLRIFRYLDEKHGSNIIITNSRYNAEKIKDRAVEIIHPPVQLPQITQVEKNGEVLTVSRLKLSKNLRKIAEIASTSPRNRLNLAGKTERGSERLINELRRFKNIEVYTNPRRDTILKLMNECSIYLSTQTNEAFGMAIVEALSLGCIPLIYRDGGPWLDIFEEQEDIGLAYTNTDEAINKIKQILEDEELRSRLRMNGIKRAKAFTTEIFRARFIEFVDTLEPQGKQDNQVFRSYRWLINLQRKLRNPLKRFRATRVPLLRR